jgi:hypothetical protein
LKAKTFEEEIKGGSFVFFVASERKKEREMWEVREEVYLCGGVGGEGERGGIMNIKLKDTVYRGMLGRKKAGRKKTTGVGLISPIFWVTHLLIDSCWIRND